MADLTYELKNRPELSDALVLLCPGAPFISNMNPETQEYDYDHIEWQTHPNWTPPPKAEVEAYLAKIQAEWDAAKKYQLSRAVTYPSIGEQLDALWHAMDEGTLPKIEPMYSDIKATKTAFPKGDPSVELVLKNDAKSAKIDNSYLSDPDTVRPYDPEGF